MIPYSKKSLPVNKGNMGTLLPEQELKAIDSLEEEKAKGKAYGFEGKTIGEISKAYARRKSRQRVLKKQMEDK